MAGPARHHRVMLAAAVAALAALAALGPPPAPAVGAPAAPAAPTASRPAPAATGGTGVASAGCLATYRPPDPARPGVWLAYDVSADHSVVAGRERIAFRPDLATSRVVLRLWANAPALRAAGGGVRVTRLQVSGPVALVSNPSANLSTLLVQPLPRRIAAGSRVVVTVDFRLRLAAGADERMGHVGGTAWFGSGAPLLAWERGIGWATEPAGTLWGERATSEDYWLAALHVRTAGTDTVLATGDAGASVAVAPGRVEHRFSASSVRDVMVAVGRFRGVHRIVSGVHLRVGVAPGVPDSPAVIADAARAAMTAHAARFGPFPYSSLAMVVLPALRGGIEFPGGIMLGTGQNRDATLSHEVAHEYFYGLVGDNQARDPWLDEAFATYAEALHRGTGPSYERLAIPADAWRRAGAPMAYWELHQSSYYRGVYVQGGAALLKARRAAGPSAFDAAIRCYVRSLARRIARPGHLGLALGGLPSARRVLVYYGALPAAYAP